MNVYFVRLLSKKKKKKKKKNTIQLSMATSLLRLFPEIQNHFEIFEHIEFRGFDVTMLLLLQAKHKMRLSFCEVAFCKKRFHHMSNQLIRDNTRRCMAKCELGRLQCIAISRHRNLPNQIRYEYFLKS
jgi:hypothetical protein